jgi:hypothetical protein
MMMKFAHFGFPGGIKVDPTVGSITEYFFGKPDRMVYVTTIVESNNKLYMSSLKGNLIAVIDYI